MSCWTLAVAPGHLWEQPSFKYPRRNWFSLSPFSRNPMPFTHWLALRASHRHPGVSVKSAHSAAIKLAFLRSWRLLLTNLPRGLLPGGSALCFWWYWRKASAFCLNFSEMAVAARSFFCILPTSEHHSGTKDKSVITEAVNSSRLEHAGVFITQLLILLCYFGSVPCTRWCSLKHAALGTVSSEEG